MALAESLVQDDRPRHKPTAPGFYLRWLCVPVAAVGVAAALIWLATLSTPLFGFAAALVWYGCIVVLTWAPLQAISAQVLSQRVCCLKATA